jgi:hypothetical protein
MRRPSCACSCRGSSLACQPRAIVAQATKVYEAHTPLEVQDELDLAEADTQVLWHFIDNEAIDVNIGSWILDLGTYRARATLC